MQKIRLQKFMADAGIMSRRAAEEQILLGKVKVNGIIASVGDTVEPGIDKVEFNGKIIISYEDDFGKIYTETVDVSTFIEEKAEQVMVVSEKDEKKNLLWWLFMLIGILIGAALVFGVQWIVKDKKQRKEDELRL